MLPASKGIRLPPNRTGMPTTFEGIYHPDIEQGFGIESTGLPSESLLGIGIRPTTLSAEEAAQLQKQGIRVPSGIVRHPRLAQEVAYA